MNNTFLNQVFDILLNHQLINEEKRQSFLEAYYNACCSHEILNNGMFYYFHSNRIVPNIYTIFSQRIDGFDQINDELYELETYFLQQNGSTVIRMVGEIVGKDTITNENQVVDVINGIRLLTFKPENYIELNYGTNKTLIERFTLHKNGATYIMTDNEFRLLINKIEQI